VAIGFLDEDLNVGSQQKDRSAGISLGSSSTFLIDYFDQKENSIS
jgi:hypothetical protein